MIHTISYDETGKVIPSWANPLGQTLEERLTDRSWGSPLSSRGQVRRLQIGRLIVVFGWDFAWRWR